MSHAHSVWEYWQIIAGAPPANVEFFDRKAGEWSTQFVAIVKLPRHLYFFANKIGLRKNTDLAALSLLKKKTEIATKIPTYSDWQ